MRTDHTPMYYFGIKFLSRLDANPYSDLCFESDWYYYEPKFLSCDDIIMTNPITLVHPTNSWDEMFTWVHMQEPFPDRLEPVPDVGCDGPPSQYRIIK